MAPIMLRPENFHRHIAPPARQQDTADDGQPPLAESLKAPPYPAANGYGVTGLAQSSMASSGP